MIKFDVIFSRTEIANCEAACFGWLSSANDEWYRRSKIQTNANKYLADEFGRGKTPMELVWYVGLSDCVTGQAAHDAWPIVKELIGEIQWLSDVVVLRPETKTVHVKLNDAQCDQSVLCIGIIRNFFTVKSFRDSYKKARDLGASIKEAYIFAGLVEVVVDWQGNWSACTRTLWEYDSLNSATFGQAALKKIFTEGYSPWKQESWENQVGYSRDQVMIEQFHGFDGDINGLKLLDTFSIENDVPIFDDQQGFFSRDDARLQFVINQIRQVMQA